jgi:hypothetical protein
MCCHCLFCYGVAIFYSATHSFIHSFIQQWLYSPLLDPGRFFCFLILYTVGRTSWTGNLPIARPLPTHRTAQNKRMQTSMCRVGLEPTTPVLELVKTVHAFRPRDHCDRYSATSSCILLKCELVGQGLRFFLMRVQQHSTR